MTSSTAARPRVRRSLVAAAVIAVVALCALGVWRPWAAPPVSIGAVDEGGRAAASVPFVLPDSPRVLIFGDSWTYGSAATLPTDGYAYVVGRELGWDVTVDGVRGSGYLKPGIDGPSFGDRIAALDPDLAPDLVIVQGSINDRALYPAGYRTAVMAAWDALADRYPEARFVVLGPAPQVLPVQRATAGIDADLAELAAVRGWTYISPIGENWITRADYGWIIDTGIGRNHPSTAGHAYLAARLADDIRALQDAADASREAPAPDQ